MAAPIPLRSDFDAEVLRQKARGSRDAAQARRSLTLATIHDGGARGDVARVGGVTLPIVRDWVVRFNAEEPPGLIERKAPEASPKLDAAQKRALGGIVEKRPVPAIHGVVRWRLIDIVQRVWEEFRVSVSPQTLSREPSVTWQPRSAGPMPSGPRARRHRQTARCRDEPRFRVPTEPLKGRP